MYIDEQSRRSVPLPSPEEKVVKGRGIFHPLDWWTVIFMLTAGAAVVFRGSRAEASEGQQGHLPTWLVRYAPRSNHHQSQITLIRRFQAHVSAEHHLSTTRCSMHHHVHNPTYAARLDLAPRWQRNFWPAKQLKNWGCVPPGLRLEIH